MQPKLLTAEQGIRRFAPQISRPLDCALLVQAAKSCSIFIPQRIGDCVISFFLCHAFMYFFSPLKMQMSLIPFAQTMDRQPPCGDFGLNE
jgi:hypothetical protein